MPYLLRLSLTAAVTAQVGNNFFSPIFA